MDLTPASIKDFRCKPCTPAACAPYAPTAGIKCGLQDWKERDLTGNQDPCCQPCCCQPCCKPCYKQPKIPDSYAPRRIYKRPTAPLESTTTYTMSYLPMDCCKNLRGIARKPLPNLVPSCDPMEGCTVQKLSYLPNPICVTQPIRPCHHDMWGQGPMQNITTQRHDYVPKPCVFRQSCKPPHKFHCLELPFENRTINRMSYINPGRVPTESYVPVKYYEKPCALMETTTTHKMSYQPVCAPAPQRPPWACKGQYQKPCQRLQDTTTYKMSYLPPGEDTCQYMNPCCCDPKPHCTWCPPTCIARTAYHCL